MPEDAVTLYRLYSPVLYGFILQFTTDEITACHILEESVKAIMDRREEWSVSDMSPIVFMKRVTRSKAIELLKKKQYEWREDNGGPSTKFLEIAGRISSVHREIFYRKYYNGMDEKEIASGLQLSEEDVKQKIRETARAFRDHL